MGENLRHHRGAAGRSKVGRLSMGTHLHALQPLIAVEFLVANDGWVASPVKAGSQGTQHDSPGSSPPASATLSGDRRVEAVPVSRLIAYKGNARTHCRKQIRQIADSIKRFGFLNHCRRSTTVMVRSTTMLSSVDTPCRLSVPCSRCGRSVMVAGGLGVIEGMGKAHALDR